MFPNLIVLGPFVLRTISVFYVLAFFVTGYIFWRKSREEHFPEDEVFDAYLLSVVLSILVARIGFIALHFPAFGLQPLKWLNIIVAPGFFPLLGMVAAANFLYHHARKQKWDAFELLDFASMAVAAGVMILSIGAFLDGSGFGTPTALPWGVTFPGLFDKRHPVQLYAFLLYFLLFLFLVKVEPKYRMFSWYRNKKDTAQSGFLFSFFLIVAGFGSAALAMFTPPEVVFLQVSLDVPIRILIGVYGCILLFRRSGRNFLPSRRYRPRSVEPIATTETTS